LAFQSFGGAIVAKAVR